MEKKISGTPHSPSKKLIWGWTKAQMGRFSQKGFCYCFEILQGLLSNKNIKISPINPILTGKWGNLVKLTLQTRVPEYFC